jgi:hypothetical protein
MQNPEVVARHLVIVARGLPTGRALRVPAGKSLYQYNDVQGRHTDTLGLVGWLMQGTLPPYETARTGQRTADYTLVPVGGPVRDLISIQSPMPSLLRYVEQSGKTWAHPQALAAMRLGHGVPCDIVCLRPRQVAQWLTSRTPRLSHLITEPLLNQYSHVHCLLSRALWSGASSA